VKTHCYEQETTWSGAARKFTKAQQERQIGKELEQKGEHGPYDHGTFHYRQAERLEGEVTERLDSVAGPAMRECRLLAGRIAGLVHSVRALMPRGGLAQFPNHANFSGKSTELETWTYPPRCE
jgi:hypothetical protein